MNDTAQTKVFPGEILMSWSVPDRERHDRGRWWYIIAITVVLVFLGYSFWYSNYLFAFIVVLAAFIIIVHDAIEPTWSDFILTTEGLVIGKKFYDYDHIKCFHIIYKPHYNLKKIYIEFSHSLRPILSIPLLDNNPVDVRQIFLTRVKENLTEAEESMSDILSRLLKL